MSDRPTLPGNPGLPPGVTDDQIERQATAGDFAAAADELVTGIVETLRSEIEHETRRAEAAIQQAMSWAMEARTANATIADCYAAAGSRAANYHGAKPVGDRLRKLRQLIELQREAIEDLSPGPAPGYGSASATLSDVLYAELFGYESRRAGETIVEGEHGELSSRPFRSGERWLPSPAEVDILRVIEENFELLKRATDDQAEGFK